MRHHGSRPALSPKESLWSIVLAGGDGTRTREFIQRELGVTTPKQFCSFVGRRSLLQHTVDRADRISPRSQRFVVVARDHRPHALPQMESRSPETLLFQPENRGTAPGVFFPLTHVFARASEATVVIYPSDHFVYPESSFVEAIRKGIAVANELEDRVVLLGVAPSGPESDYGWIQPGSAVSRTKLGEAFEVASFIEKPARKAAESALLGGALWNTSIVIGRLATLWALGWRYLEKIMVPFVELWDSLGRPQEEQVLDRIYRTIPVLDFSRDLLQAASKHLAVMKLEGVFWSDWGSPARILDTLHTFGLRPAYSRMRAERSAARRRVTTDGLRAY